MYEYPESPEVREQRERHEMERRRWEVRLHEFVAQHAAELWGVGGPLGDGQPAVHGVGVRVSDTEQCIVLYVQKRTNRIADDLVAVREQAEKVPDAFRFKISIIVQMEPRPKPRKPSER